MRVSLHQLTLTKLTAARLGKEFVKRSYVALPTSHYWRTASSHTLASPVSGWETQRLSLVVPQRLFQTSGVANMSAKRALVIIANGSEEIEAVTPIDTLRRAGVEVTVAGVEGAGNTIMSRNVIVGAEVSLKDALSSAPYDAVILPGGLKGSEAFIESSEVGELLQEQEKAGRLIGAICAAPTALHKHGICVGRAVTSYPTMKGKMTEGEKYNYKEERVVIDGNLITSRGPGTSLEFSLALAAYLVGQEKADEVGKAMLVK